MTMSDFPNALLGKTVCFKRSNGYMQEATISRIMSPNDVVVEWEENEITYGKQISIDQLSRWNPDLKSFEDHDSKEADQKNNALDTKKADVEHNLKLRRVPRCTTVKGELDFGLPVSTESIASSSSSSLKPTAVVQEPPQPAIPPKRSPRPSFLPKIDRDSHNANGSCEMVKENLKPRRTTMMGHSDRGAKSGSNSFEILIAEIRDTIKMSSFQMNPPNYQQQPLIVCVRKRPLNTKETARGDIDIITIPDQSSVMVHECKHKVDMTKYVDTHNFNFDYVFDENCDNRVVFSFTSKPLIECMFNEGIATCFAYGQTGSGKTFTMVGNDKLKTERNSDELSPSPGIYELTAFDIFLQMKQKKLKNHRITVQFYEVYMDKIFDLLNGRKVLRIMEDQLNRVQLFDVKEFVVQNTSEVMEILRQGLKNRTSGKTSANATSSRSHAIFQFNLQTKPNIRRPDWLTLGRFSLVDLAGNERGADTSADNAATRKEGAEINKSLLALKECIRALWRKGLHIPFRSSKLTHVLRESFLTERSKTCMIATISPGNNSSEHSLDTLRYADRLRSSVTDKRVENDGNVGAFHDSPISSSNSAASNSHGYYQNGDEKHHPENQKRSVKVSITEHKNELNDQIKHELADIGNEIQSKQAAVIEDFSVMLDSSKLSLGDCIQHLSEVIEKNLSLYRNVQDRLRSLKETLQNEEENNKCFQLPPTKNLRRR